MAAHNHLLRAGLLDRIGLEDPSELFFDTPGGGQFVGGVIDGEHPIKTGFGPLRQGVVAAEQQSAVRPRRIDLSASPVLPVPDQPLPHPGHHQVPQLHQMEPVHRNLRVRQLLVDGFTKTLLRGR